MTSPSIGEQAAISGYSAQYIIAAEIIYEHIKQGRLEWVRLIDPEAGRLDDLVVGSTGRVDAYQVKWASSKGTYTFANITRPSEGKPSIWRQLADGWKSLAVSYPNAAVRVHFVTNEIASANTNVPEAAGVAITFQQFWADVFRPFDGPRLPPSSLHAKYRAAIDALRIESGLTASEFDSFLLQCALSFDKSDPRQGEGVTFRAKPALEDLQKLATYLQQRVALGTAPVTITRDGLLDDLQWTQRVSQYFQHYLAVDLSTYRPIEPTTADIRGAIADRRFGYVALLGGPGSGKSTTLTHTLRYAAGIRLVTYYAYIKSDPALGRGEAASFWRDIFVAIADQGVRPTGPLPRSGDEFRAAVLDQFRQLSEEWSSRGIITVLLIDGLDHIQREQRPSESLIKQLPLPEQIPAGIIVFLGSQTLSLSDLAPTIKAHVALPGRTLTMGRLSRAAVVSMAKAVLGESPHVLPSDLDVLFERGEGHPLATIYLLGELGSASSNANVEEILNEARTFGSDVEMRYQAYWQAISDDASKHLLALLARIRIPVDLLDSLSWVPNLNTHAFLFNTKHFFQELDEHRWTFFHNSFRQFLLRKTSENALDRFEAAIDKRHHAVLAGMCAKSASLTMKREALFHNFMAEDFRSVIEQGTQQYFRAQFLELRHPYQIFEDISLVLRAASHELDGLAVARAWLVELELREREQALEDASLRVSLDTFLGDEELVDAISETGHLFVDRADALRATGRLLEKGRVVQAKALFDLAEPLDVLAGITKAPTRYDEDNDNLLFNWLAVATEFREVADVLTAISRVRADTNPPHDESWTQDLRVSLLTSLGATCMSRGSEAWGAFKAHPLVVEFGDSLLEDIDWRVAATGSPEMRSQALHRVIARTRSSELDPHTRTYLADLMRRNGYDAGAIEALLEGVVQPPLADIHDSSSYLRISAFSHRILLNRLLAFLGRPQSPADAVPWPSDARLQVLARLERALVSVANLWGRGLRGDVLTGPEIVLHLHHAIRFYYQDRSDVHIGWYQFNALAREFFETIVRATEPHGAVGLAALGEEFDRLWADGDIRSYWPTDLRVAIAVNLFRYGGSSQLLAQRLDRADDQDDADRDLEERLRVLLDLARAWRLVGNEEQTSNCLKRMLQGSFGIYHDKDRQIQSWVDWLDRAVQNGGTTLMSELPKFAAALSRIVEARRGRGAQEAGQHLVAVCFRESPSLGGELSDRLLRQGTIEYARAVSGMVSGLFERSDASFSTSLCYLAHIGVALGLPDTQELAQKLVRTAAAQQVENLPSALSPFIESLRTHEFANNRQGWFSGLVDGLQHAGISPSGLERLIDETPAIHHDPSSTTQLRDGSTVQTEEVVKGIHDFDSLIDAITRVVPDSDMSWDRISRPYIETADEGQLNALQGVLAGSSSVHARLSIAVIDRYIALKALETGRELASDFFVTAPAIGWIEWFDGGTKIKPALQLIRIDASGSRPVIFRSMINDYLTEIRNPRDFVSSLDDLVPILFSTVPWHDLWTEIHEHVSQLSEFGAEARPFEAAGEVSADQALLKSVIKLFALTIPELEQRCAVCLAALANGSESMRAAVIAGLGKSGLPHWKAALVLFLSGGGGDCEPLLVQFSDDKDLSVRVIARKLTDGLANRDDLRQPRDWTSAPVALRIGLPPSESDEPSIPVDAIKSGQLLAKPRTPLDLFHIWLSELNALAGEAHIPLENLLERAWQLAKQYESQLGIGDDAERELRNYLSAIELQIAYRRPWGEVAALALQALWAELVDYGRVAPDTVLRYGVHRIFDEVLIRKGARPRPDKWVVAMASGTVGPPDNWLTSTDEALGNLAFHRAARDGLVVVAEFSRFVAHDWQLSTETRTAFLTGPSVTGTRVQLTSDTDWFPNVGHQGTESYLSRSTPNGDMFVGGNAYRLRCGPTKWLAIAPDLAIGLHLSPSEQPFTWIDSNGLPSAWSVYWRDGPGRRQPPNFDHVYGSGWLVLVRRDKLIDAGVRNFRLHAWCIRHSHGTHGRPDEQRSSNAETPVAI